MHVSVAESKRLSIPLFAINPSRCVQFMNMISPADLFDAEEIFRVKDDLVQECQQYGEILALEIPRPVRASEVDLQSAKENVFHADEEQANDEKDSNKSSKDRK